MAGFGTPERALSVIGKDHKRVDAEQIVTGAAKYTSDLYLPDMLYGRFLGSKYAHAKITDIDTSKAEALPGVVAVYTYKNCTLKHPNWRDCLLLTNHPRFMGQEVALVIAEDPKTAEQALDLMDVKYEALPFVLEPEEAMKPEAPQIHEGGNTALGYPDIRKRGDLEAGFKEADRIFEGRFETGMTQASPNEMRTAVAYMPPGSDEVTLWLTDQYVHLTRTTLAKVLTMPESKIRVIATFVGGGFGDRWYHYTPPALAIFVTQKLGRPVKVELSRREQLSITAVRWRTILELKFGVKTDGTLTAMSFKKIHDAGSAGSPTKTQADLYTYICPNFKYEGLGIHTNKINTGAHRGMQDPIGTWAQEIFMDTIAHELGMDPVEFRLKNATVKAVGQQEGRPWSSCGLKECITKGAEKFGWKWPYTPVVVGSKKRGIGMACHVSYCGYIGLPMAATIYSHPDGTFTLNIGNVDVGQGNRTEMAMIAAEVLGARLEDVHVINADTAVTQDAGGAGGSGQTMKGGSGTVAAALDCRQQLFEVAAEMLKVDPKDLESKDGEIYVKAKPDTKVSIAKVATAAGMNQDIALLLVPRK